MTERVLSRVVFVIGWIVVIAAVFRAQVDWPGLLIGLFAVAVSGANLLVGSDVLRDHPDEER